MYKGKPSAFAGAAECYRGPDRHSCGGGGGECSAGGGRVAGAAAAAEAPKGNVPGGAPGALQGVLMSL